MTEGCGSNTTDNIRGNSDPRGGTIIRKPNLEALRKVYVETLAHALQSANVGEGAARRIRVTFEAGIPSSVPEGLSSDDQQLRQKLKRQAVEALIGVCHAIRPGDADRDDARRVAEAAARL